MDWLRWHHGTINDPRLRLVSRRSDRPVVLVLAVLASLRENASAATPRGTVDASRWSDEDVGVALDAHAEDVQAVREAMQGKYLDGWRLIDWERENPKREREDDSKERVRAYRQRQRHETTEKPTKRHVTPRNAKEKSREEENRVEKKEQLPPPTGEGDDRTAAPPDPGDNLLGWWIKTQERTTGRRPPDTEIAKQGRAAKQICAERTPEEINRAIKGMPQLFKFSRGEPWDLLDLKNEFQAALNVSLENGNGNGKPRKSDGDWRNRPARPASQDPQFQHTWGDDDYGIT